MMSPEQKREQLLKRVLPALAISVLYFVVVNGILAEKLKKAEQDYRTLISSGVSKDALPSIMQQQSQTQQQIASLKAKHQEQQQQLASIAGFLTGSTPTNNVAAEISTILASHAIKLQEETHEQLEEKKLGVSLSEVWQFLKPPTPAPDSAKPVEAKSAGAANILVHRLRLKGSYNHVYQALDAIANSDLQVLPVSLTMQTPDTQGTGSDDLDWELVLWL